ncbi:Endonuclease/exonuclease/phosphatase [Crepidotus variabilis]|uniref:Endonuclease/exonuclease/phosphatase n=1 Tax=Crepidotus variabilis TaxID=179855 RepID=A0A9P6JK24_9AGAR|nr:Endonuclease/exonuclease/phosphatase [Crepidotus variabilis]
MSSPSTFMATELETKKRTESVLSRFKHAMHTNANASSPLYNGLPTIEDIISPGNGTVNPKFLKIRFITWNMHDSLPKGDLEELLGKVPVYNPSPSKPGAFPRLPDDAFHPFHLVVIAGQECPTPSGIPMALGAGLKLYDREKDKDDEEEGKETDEEDKEEPEKLTGWTQIVEDWLCNGGGTGMRSTSPSTASISTPKPLIRQKSAREPRKGPYQLLVKERLMGIYLAIYIHRELKPMVKGISKASVTAGLIGGRLGNKGGVGIGLNLDGTTLLFLNAHLAAHEGRVHHRLANLLKIKSELEVDSFLSNKDPRNTAEDITDKFDFTFLCGDLNFRLDISRLHADWLIAKQEYAKAFAFDQLSAIMKKKAGEFEGFHEAPINFPPTFKYDVLRTLKRSKRSDSKASNVGDQTPFTDDEGHRTGDRPDDDEGTDAASSMSSIHSRDSEAEPEEGYFQRPAVGTPATPATPTIITSTSKVSVGTAGSGLPKSKAKWMSILSPSFGSPKLLKFKHSESWAGQLSPSTPNSAAFPPSPLSANTITTPQSASVATPRRKFLRPPPMVLVSSSGVSQNSMMEETIDGEKIVYDSSSKKRVPSWCDRILWKTTIPKPLPLLTLPELDDSSSHKPSRKFSQILTDALRSPPSRHLRDTKSPLFSSQSRFDRQPSSAGIREVTRIDPRPPMSAAPNGSFKPDDIRATRRSQSDYSPPPTAPLLHQTSPRRSTVASPTSPGRPTSASSSIWRFIPSFFSPTHPNAPTSAPLPPAYVKGDVVCLHYGTLDDRGMRRLEGRSDHRPVIGAYAVYI